MSLPPEQFELEKFCQQVAINSTQGVFSFAIDLTTSDYELWPELINEDNATPCRTARCWLLLLLRLFGGTRRNRPPQSDLLRVELPLVNFPPSLHLSEAGIRFQPEQIDQCEEAAGTT